MLARGALRCLAAEVPKQAAHDLPKLAALVQAARAGYALPLRTLSHASQLQTRSYATEPTATVKKAVKAKAAAGKSVKETTSAKKPAAKKKPTAKKPVKKAAPKKAKKKAAPKKPARKPKKELTEEEKKKQVISKLRKLALREPVARRQVTAYNVYLQEHTKNIDGKRVDLAEVAQSWKNITSAEHEKFNRLAAERSEERLAQYKAWVESHTPDQIRIANNARNLLRRKLSGTLKNNATPAHTQRIVDERAVKRPVTAWTSFFGERAASSDFKSIALVEKTKLISGEWKALNSNEKQRYEDQAAADRQRYSRELAAQATA